MKLTVCVAALLVGSLLPLRAQQPAPKPPDHMQHRFDDPARFAKSFDDPKRDAWQMPERVIAALALEAQLLRGRHWRRHGVLLDAPGEGGA